MQLWIKKVGSGSTQEVVWLLFYWLTSSHGGRRRTLRNDSQAVTHNDTQLVDKIQLFFDLSVASSGLMVFCYTSMYYHGVTVFDVFMFALFFFLTVVFNSIWYFCTAVERVPHLKNPLTWFAVQVAGSLMFGFCFIPKATKIGDNTAIHLFGAGTAFFCVIVMLLDRYVSRRLVRGGDGE